MWLLLPVSTPYCDSTDDVAGSFTTQLLPELSYHLESSAGSLVTFKIDRGNKTLWDKYSPQNFPVITWPSASRSRIGKETGSVYAFPRNDDGVIKIGFRGIKVRTHMVRALLTRSLQTLSEHQRVFRLRSTGSGLCPCHMRSAGISHSVQSMR